MGNDKNSSFMVYSSQPPNIKLITLFLFVFLCIFFYSGFTQQAFADTIYIHPRGAGLSTQWTLNAGAANWDACNDEASNAATGGPSTNDATTSYISSNTLNQRDSYLLDDNLITSGSTITDIQVFLTHRRAGTSPATIKLSYRRNGIDAGYIDSTTTFTPGGGWATGSQTWSSLNWTLTDLNALQIGVLLNATGTNAAQVTQLYVLVTYTPPITPPSVVSQPDASNTQYGTYVDSPFDLSAQFNGNGASTTCEYCKSTDGTCDTEWAAASGSGTGTFTCSATSLTGTNGQSLILNMRATNSGGTTTATAITRTVDTTAPSTTDNASNVWTAASPVTVTLYPSDTGSLVANTYSCLDTATPGTCAPGTIGTAVSVTCAGGNDCIQYVRYYSIDNVGNTETTKTSAQAVRQDLKVPTAPTGFSATDAGSGGTCNISWNSDAADTGSGLNTSAAFKVYYQTGSAPACGAGTLGCTQGSSSTSCSIGSLSNGIVHYFRQCVYDNLNNQTSNATTATCTPTQPAGPSVTAASSGTQTATMEAGSTSQYVGAAFTFQQSSGTADTITALTISDTGTAVANTQLTNVKVYYESGQASCTYNGTESSINTSFNASDQIVLSSISIPLTLSPNFTCVYVVFNVALSAVNNSTIDLQITSSADFTLSGGTTKAGSYPVTLSGTTTLLDTTAPGNITGLSITPGNAQLTLDWANPSDSDYAGVRIARAMGSVPPTDCSAYITTVAAPGTSYVDSPLSNGQLYSYTLCSYDEVPNYSLGTTSSGTPAAGPSLSAPSETGYTDYMDPNYGNTTTNAFRFKVIYESTNAPSYMRVCIGDNDETTSYPCYDMTADTGCGVPYCNGSYSDGEQFVYGPIGLGAVQDIRFYFEANDGAGTTKSPSNAPTSYYTGPSVYLLYGQNMVGVPKCLGASCTAGLSYNSVLADDSGYSWCQTYNSTGLFTGAYVNCASGSILTGKGYWIWGRSSNVYRLDEPAGVGNISSATFDINLQVGWNMISNPYNKRIPLQGASGSRCTVVRDSVESADYATAVINGWIGSTIYEYEGSISGYAPRIYDDPAVIEPWLGYWIYVPDNTFTTGMILKVYRD